MEAVFLVTSASAISILADRFIASVLGFVLVRAVVISVATGTVGLECSVLPDNNFGIVAVTVGALQITAMVQWFERRCRVTEVIGQKRIGVVAAIAFHCGNKVPGILADRSRAVVAGRTGAEYLGVIYVKRGRPDSWCMTVFAGVCRKCVLRILACCYRAVVTTETIAIDIGVVKIRGQPRDCSMAIVAIVAARNVCRMPAGCRDAVVTGSATT